MPYALSNLVTGKTPSWREVRSSADLVAGDVYREAKPPPGWVWDAALSALRAPTTAESTATANLGADDTYYCELQISANQTVAHLIWERVLWDVEVADPRDWHAASPAPARVRPGAAGMYLVHLNGLWASNSTGERMQRVVRNDTTVAGTDRISAATASQGIQTTTVLVYLGAGDYVTAEAWQNSGAGLGFDMTGGRLVVAKVV